MATNCISKKKALAFLRQNRLGEARALYQKICAADGRDVEALAQLGAINGQMGLFAEAVECFRKAVALQPRLPLLHFNLGNALFGLRRLAEAEDAFRQALELDPRHAGAGIALGTLLLEAGRAAEAAAVLESTARLAPDNAVLHARLGRAQEALGRLEEAERSYRRVVALQPGHPEGHYDLGSVLRYQGRLGEARAAFEQALELKPDFQDALAGLAWVCLSEGRHEEAGRLLGPLVEAGTDNINVMPAFSHLCRRLSRCEEAIGRMEGILAGRPLPPADRKLLHFRLGHLYDRQGDPEAAFGHFRAANDLETARFDAAAHRALVDRSIAVFTRECLAGAREGGGRGEGLVFIVGMPRSGTSLTEQILACHAAVFGAGELRDIPELARGLAAERGIPWPEAVAGLDPARAASLADRHLRRLRGLAGEDAQVLIDKLWSNFLYLGLIALLFPGARVIHCRRDPLDTCLSIWFQNFGQHMPCASRLRDIAAYYGQYRRLMAHWKAVLPLPMLELDYEDLVRDQEGWTRRLLEFCGLEWEEACLRFHESGRYARTVSHDQVTEPLNDRAVGRWRRYERHLGELSRALSESGIIDPVSES